MGTGTSSVTPGRSGAAPAVPWTLVFGLLREMASSWQSLLVSDHGPPRFSQAPLQAGVRTTRVPMALQHQRWHGVCTGSRDSEALWLACGTTWGPGARAVLRRRWGSGQSGLPLGRSGWTAEVAGGTCFPRGTRGSLRPRGQTWAQRLGPHHQHQGERPGPALHARGRSGEGPTPTARPVCLRGVLRSRPHKPQAARSNFTSEGSRGHRAGVPVFKGPHASPPGLAQGYGEFPLG